MKIAVSSTGPDLNSQVDFRFGRCPYFVIVEVEGKEIKRSESVENTSMNQMGGAGITAAQTVANKGVNVVITGNMGPRAFTIFEQFGIEVYQGSGTVKEVVENYLRGELRKLSIPAGFGRGRGFGMGRGGR